MEFLTIVLYVLSAMIAVLWVLMPFAIFASRDLLRKLLREQERTNELLTRLNDSSRTTATAATAAAGPVVIDCATRQP